MLLRTVSIPNSFIQGYRPFLFDIRQLQVVVVPVRHSSSQPSRSPHVIIVCDDTVLRHPCSRYRRVKSAGAVTLLSVRSATSTWFDHSAEDSSREGR